MDNQQIASALWGGSPTPQQAAPATQEMDLIEAFGGTAAKADTSPPPNEDASLEARLEMAFGWKSERVTGDLENPAPAVPEHDAGATYDAWIAQAEQEGDAESAADYKTSRDALTDYSRDAWMTDNQVHTLMAGAKEVMAAPITDPAEIGRGRDAAEAALRAEWGDQYEQTLELAKREAERLMKHVPWAREVLQLGGGNNPAVIKALAAAGRERRGRSLWG